MISIKTRTLNKSKRDRSGSSHVNESHTNLNSNQGIKLRQGNLVLRVNTAVSVVDPSNRVICRANIARVIVALHLPYPAGLVLACTGAEMYWESEQRGENYNTV